MDPPTIMTLNLSFVCGRRGVVIFLAVGLEEDEEEEG